MRKWMGIDADDAMSDGTNDGPHGPDFTVSRIRVFAIQEGRSRNRVFALSTCV